MDCQVCLWMIVDMFMIACNPLAQLTVQNDFHCLAKAHFICNKSTHSITPVPLQHPEGSIQLVWQWVFLQLSIAIGIGKANALRSLDPHQHGHDATAQNHYNVTKFLIVTTPRSYFTQVKGQEVNNAHGTPPTWRALVWNEFHHHRQAQVLSIPDT